MFDQGPRENFWVSVSFLGLYRKTLEKNICAYHLVVPIRKRQAPFIIGHLHTSIFVE